MAGPASNPYSITGVSLAQFQDSAGVFSDNGTTPAVVGTTVQLWKDTIGGFNATQGTASNRPTYTLDPITGLSTIRFQPLTSNGTANVWNPNQGLDIPSGLAFNRNNVACYIVCRGVHGNQTVAFGASSSGQCPLWLGTGGGNGAVAIVSTLNSSPVTNGAGAMYATVSGNIYNTSQGSAIGEQWQTIGVNSNNGSATITLDGFSNTGSGVTSQSQTGGRIGNLVSSYPFDGFIREIFVAINVTSADHTSIMAQIATKYGLVTPTSQVIVGIESNSWGEAGQASSGVTNVYGTSIGAYLIPKLPSTTKIVNVGVAGLPISTSNTNKLNYTNLINYNFSGNVFVVRGGINDLVAAGGNGSSGLGTLENNTRAFCQSIRGAGGHVIMCQEVNQTGTANAAIQPSIIVWNAWIAANWQSFADQYLPMPTALVDNTNTTYYDPIDLTHLLPPGRQIMAAALAPLIAGLNVVSGFGPSLPSGIGNSVIGYVIPPATPTDLRSGVVVANVTGTLVVPPGPQVLAGYPYGPGPNGEQFGTAVDAPDAATTLIALPQYNAGANQITSLSFSVNGIAGSNFNISISSSPSTGFSGTGPWAFNSGQDLLVVPISFTTSGSRTLTITNTGSLTNPSPIVLAVSAGMPSASVVKVATPFGPNLSGEIVGTLEGSGTSGTNYNVDGRFF